MGKTLRDVPTPSIILDLAKLEVNCQRMMDAAEKNGIGWRAHIKTHKVSLDVFPSRHLHIADIPISHRRRSSRGSRWAKIPTLQRI